MKPHMMGRLVVHSVCVCALGAALLVGCTEVFNPITEIIDSTGDGEGNILDGTLGVSVDGSGNVYVSGRRSDNVFKIEPNGTITQIIDATGDRAGNLLEEPLGVPVDAAGNVYVGGHTSNNVFKIEPDGTITEIIDATGDRAGNPT